MKEKIIIRKKWIRSLILIFAVTLIASMGTVSTVSAKAKSKWAQAYLKVIASENKKNSGLTYNLIYFNNDSIPELVAGYDYYWVSMYTYSGGKTYELMDSWAYGSMGNAGYSYLPKKNVLYNTNSDYAGAVVYTTYMRMKNNKMTDIYKKPLYLSYLKNMNESPWSAGNYLKNPVYYYGNKKISKAKYDKYQIKGNYKTIKGKYTYAKMKSILNKK